MAKTTDEVRLITHLYPNKVIYNNLIWSYDTDTTANGEYIPKALWDSVSVDDLSAMAQDNIELSGLDAGAAWHKKAKCIAKVRVVTDGVHVDYELLNKFDQERLKKPKCILSMKNNWIDGLLVSLV